jgi:hypothetical protein
MADELTAVTGEPTSGPTTARIEELRASAVRKRASVFRVVSFGPLGGSARRQVEALNEVIAIYDLAIVGRHSAARIIKAEATANTRTELAGRMRRRAQEAEARVKELEGLVEEAEVGLTVTVDALKTLDQDALGHEFTQGGESVLYYRDEMIDRHEGLLTRISEALRKGAEDG